ncbi:restriction endonuclease subunit S [Tepidibacillus decaturensis]|uniref:restriction endonuclease subunit S n=1 Tax=Tepidibacillus decaturensis TaxID=1413211 RepID=UPI000838DC0F|nr:restriction endonuclease subunit S [Tepidibacillus decaturensis]
MSFSEWRKTKVDEVAEAIFSGGTPNTKIEEYWNGEYNWLSSGETRNAYIKQTEKTITSEGVNNSSTRLALKDDVVIASAGQGYTRGQVSYCMIDTYINQSIIAIRAKKDELLPKYLFFNLRNRYEELRQISDGNSIRGSITTKHIKALDIFIPPLPEQKAIAATLSALDDMIELNNQINKTLEEMAQALFKSWFVDFEPFKDGEFEESELGLIPKGWRVGTLSSIGDIIGGGTPSKSKPEYYADSGIPWITPKDLSMNKNKYISRGQFDISELGLRESSAKLMPKGTVLFSSRAPIGYIAIAKNAVTTNQGFKSIVPFNNISSEYVYLLLKNNIGEIESRASGSTFKEISGGEMKKVPIILPPMDVINQFNEIATTLGKVQALLEDENNILSSIRDTLLPKLMSGEIRVPVEEVV